jgi:hypothetical protein
MPRKHHGPYEPRHGEPVTDGTRHGRAEIAPGCSGPTTVVSWSDGTVEKVPTSSLSHDHANCGDGGGINHCGW